MTISLEDVALLFGLPYVGEAMGATDLPESWRQDIFVRFVPVVRNNHAPGPVNDFTNTHRPTSSWLR
jgi:hypothetical protein